jgi:hypothetical protein
MKGISIFVVLFFVPLFAAAQGTAEAERFRRFEREWLTADLNSDDSWRQRFLAGRLGFGPADARTTDARAEQVRSILDPALSANEMKVRITGTISLLTNDTAKNRSFQFLDTFNKKNGRWQVIASSISPAGSPEEPAVPDPKKIEAELIRLENEWRQVDVANDRSVFDRLIAREFVGTSITGVLRRRDEWIKAWEFEKVQRAENKEMAVNVLSPDLAIATGVDITTKLDAGGNEVVHRDRFTDTWVRRESRWQVVAAHVTRLK